MKAKEKITPQAIFIDLLLLTSWTIGMSEFWILVNPLLNAMPVVNIIGIPVSTRLCVNLLVFPVSISILLLFRYFVRKTLKIGRERN